MKDLTLIYLIFKQFIVKFIDAETSLKNREYILYS